MVMLARALAQDTELILMDEPTAHLDFKNELLFLETVEHLVKQENVAVLMATHAPNQAFHLANAGVSTQVAVLHEGRLFRQGPPRKVLTEDLLREVFGIQACVLERRPESSDERFIRQIVAQKTIRKDGCAAGATRGGKRAEMRCATVEKGDSREGRHDG